MFCSKWPNFVLKFVSEETLFYMGFRVTLHSHSIVDGGFEDISNVTLEIPETSLMIRVDT